MIPTTFRFIRKNGQIVAIQCLVCTMTSWSRGDIEHLYCGSCHAYHLREAEATS